VRFALFLAALPLAWGQLSPSTLNFTQRQQGENPYFQVTMVPGSGQITIGTCTATTSTNICPFTSITYCFADYQASSNCYQGTSSTTYCGGGNGVCWGAGGGNFNLAPGTYSFTVPVTRAGGSCSSGCTLTVNWTVVAYTAPTFKDPLGESSPGQTAGYTTSGAPFFDLEISQPTNMRPGGTFDLPSSVTGTVTDPDLGATLTRISPSWNGINYATCGDSVTSQWNSDDSITCIQVIWDPSGATNGNIYFVSASTGAILFTNPPNRNMSWSTVSNNVYYYMPGSPTGGSSTGACINEVVLDLSNNIIASNTQIPNTCTTTGGALSYTNGGDGGVSAGDLFWGGVTEVPYGTPNPAQLVCLLRLDDSAAPACASFGSLPALAVNCGSTPTNPGSLCESGAGNYGIPRTVQIMKNYSQSGNFWVLLSSYAGGANEWYSLHPGATSLTDEGTWPIAPDGPFNSILRGTPVFKVTPTSFTDCANTGDCRYAFHMDMVSSAGHQFLLYPLGPQYPSYFEMSFVDPDVGVPLINVSAEAGGGEYETFYLNAAGDTHLSCGATAPACSVDVDAVGAVLGSSQQMRAYAICGISTGSTTTITTCSAYGGSNGDLLEIGGVAGVTGISGAGTTCTVALLSGTSFQCSGLVTSGTWTSNSGSVTLNSSGCPGSPTTLCGHVAETILYDASNILSKQFTVTRLLKHRSIGWLPPYDHTGGSYYGDPHSTCSADMSVCAQTSNGGVPDYYAVYMYSTGFAPVGTGTGAGAILLGGQINGAVLDQ